MAISRGKSGYDYELLDQLDLNMDTHGYPIFGQNDVKTDDFTWLWSVQPMQVARATCNTC